MRIGLRKNQRGAALLETAVTLPLILLISVAIFEFGRAYQTWQVLTNGAREGARVSVINGTSPDQVKAAVIKYANVGGIRSCSDGPAPCIAPEHITVDQGVDLGGRSGSQITIQYPFDFIVLNPIARMVAGGSRAGQPITMSAVAVMRNES
ncbi:MAG TPA: TadE family protein [Vicinamibacterales bacterium]|nr:TadE family protein [Vicinamibacterales bacterium]